jgi:diguanylate cyclase (GGDEF)-like protein/PAS domain S-box-containing protein
MNMQIHRISTGGRGLEREQLLEMLLAELDGMVYRCRNDEHWTMEFVSEGCLALTGYPREELLGNAGRSYESIIHPQDRDRVRDEVGRALSGGLNFNLEYRLIHADGSVKWVWERGTASPSVDGQTPMIHGFIQDITQRHLQEKALREAEQRYRSIFENANEGIFQTTADGHYLEVNPALAAIYGYRSTAELISALDDIAAQLYVNPERRREFTETLRQNDTLVNFESQVFRKDRTIIWISENAHVVRDGDGNVLYYEGTVEDITARKNYEQRIAHQATHDVLTGLPNRALLVERIEMAIVEAPRTGACFAVVFIDLDHFKTVNDTMGHATGDLLIREVSRRLLRCVREGDTVARIGGDEFVLLLPEIRSDGGNLIHLIERVLTAVRKPCLLGGREFTVGCSIGISLHPADGVDADTLLKHADIAMYQAKEGGRNNYQFFTEEFNRTVMENHELEHQLRHALAASSFEMYYQPIVEASTGRLVKAEALIRWQTERGFVSPARFIPIAENVGLIEPLGNWVLEAVCQQLAAWAAAGLPPLPVSINISPRQFNQPDLARNIGAALQRHGLAPGLLEIEITESCLARDKKKFLQTLAEMKALGLHVAIDDFGSGYSNMDCLKSMHFSSLKIDRSFIASVEEQDNHRAIYRALISMAHNLSLVVVAEGVETQQQVDFLCGIGCDLIQGYHFSLPLPAVDFAALRTGQTP